MEPCPICGFSNNLADSVYCTECGAQLVAPPQQVSPPPQQVSPPPQQVSPQPQQVSQGASLKLPDNSAIQVDSTLKCVGRSDLLNYLKTVQGLDPMIISRQHFTIFSENGKYYVEDGNTAVQDKPSANHTYLNGADITEKGRQELKNDDVIDLANTVKLTFKIQ